VLVLVLVLVLEMRGAYGFPATDAGHRPIGATKQGDSAMTYAGGFDHEKLDVYRLSIEFQRWVGPLIEAGLGKGARLSAAKHLDEASTSISNNIAEGNGKRSAADRCRYLDIARGSALECAACLDVLVARNRVSDDLAR